MKDKIELTEEMVNTLENPPKANNAFKVAAKKYKGEDIKMADIEWLVEDRTIYTLKSNGTNDFWFYVNRSGYSENHVIESVREIADKLNNHDNLSQQVKDLEFSLDDRDCYIADADMKNEALTKQVAELRAALGGILGYCDTITGGPDQLHAVFCLTTKALKDSQ